MYVVSLGLMHYFCKKFRPDPLHYLFAALTFDDIDTFFKEPIELCQQFLDLSKKFNSCKPPSVIVSIVNVA